MNYIPLSIGLHGVTCVQGRQLGYGLTMAPTRRLWGYTTARIPGQVEPGM